MDEQSERPAGTFYVKRACGCLLAVAADMPNLRNDTAIMIARCIADGYTDIGYTTDKAIIQTPWECPQCTPRSTGQLEVLARTTNTGAWYRVKGSMTYQVTVHLNHALQTMETDEEAIGTEIFERCFPVSLHDEEATIEWEEEELTIEPMESPMTHPSTHIQQSLFEEQGHAEVGKE